MTEVHAKGKNFQKNKWYICSGVWLRKLVVIIFKHQYVYIRERLLKNMVKDRYTFSTLNDLPLVSQNLGLWLKIHVS